MGRYPSSYSGLGGGETILLLLLIIGFLLWVFFKLYLKFKILQFIIQAINLYKKILYREDAIIKLLLDIRDNTKTAGVSSDDLSEYLDESPPPRGNTYCPFCQKSDAYFDANGNLFCPHCRKVLDPALSLSGKRVSESVEKGPNIVNKPVLKPREPKGKEGPAGPPSVELPTPAPAAPVAGLFCSQCGQAAEADDKFCTACGQKLKRN